jgi:uncharacterized protein YegP (UPF0339 family)
MADRASIVAPLHRLKVAQPGRRSSLMAHKFVIKKTDGGQYRAYFKYNAESIFWTETYTTKASAQKAIDSIKKNGPGADTVEE